MIKSRGLCRTGWRRCWICSCRLTLYLDPEVYDRLRDIAHEERTKMHPLILEGIALMMKKRSKRNAA